MRDDNFIVKGIGDHEVIFTKLRGARPQDFVQQRQPKKQEPKDCFFCPGNENLTPPELGRVEAGAIAGSAGENGGGLERGAHTPSWACRCFENKFPAIKKSWKNAYGCHEVIVETPRHDLTVSQLEDRHWEAFLGLVASRAREQQKDKKIKYTLVFKNEGNGAGASLEHTHTQIASLDFVPGQIAQLAKTGCADIRKWRQDKKNLVFSQDGFDVFCPPASTFHFEMWIAPKKRIASITGMDKAELRGLAGAMKKALAKLDKTTGFGAYNIAYILAPKGEKNFHMHVRIMPRLSTWAGFELGCGAIMNSVPPQAAAQILRKA